LPTVAGGEKRDLSRPKGASILGRIAQGWRRKREKKEGRGKGFPANAGVSYYEDVPSAFILNREDEGGKKKEHRAKGGVPSKSGATC